MDLNLIFKVILGFAAFSACDLIIYSIITKRFPMKFVVNVVSFGIGIVGCVFAHVVFVKNLHIPEQVASAIVGFFVLFGTIGFIKYSIYLIDEDNQDPML